MLTTMFPSLYIVQALVEITHQILHSFFLQECRRKKSPIRSQYVVVPAFTNHLTYTYPSLPIFPHFFFFHHMSCLVTFSLHDSTWSTHLPLSLSLLFFLKISSSFPLCPLFLVYPLLLHSLFCLF